VDVAEGRGGVGEVEPLHPLGRARLREPRHAARERRLLLLLLLPRHPAVERGPPRDAPAKRRRRVLQAAESAAGAGFSVRQGEAGAGNYYDWAPSGSISSFPVGPKLSACAIWFVPFSIGVGK
jgi:hypothetical protein